MPKVSIIVPAFNAVKTIDDSVNSLIFQTLTDIEIVVVDDCSTDGTYEKLLSFSRNHKRIKLLKNEKNLSASIARKRGVEAATGKYVMFLDSDDVLRRSACELAFTEIEARGVDVLQFGVNINSNGATPGQIAWFDGFVNNKSDQKYNGGLLNRCFVDKNFGFTIWNKIYKTNIAKVATSKMPDIPIFKAQDLLLQFYILFYSFGYASVGDVLYDYSYGAGLTGGSKFDKEKIEKHMSQSIVLTEVYNFLASKKLEGYHKSVIHSIALTLIEDNLATVGKCINTYLDDFAKDQFLLNWGDGVDCQPDGISSGLSKVLSGVFDEISLNPIYKSLHYRPSESDIRGVHQELLLELKESFDKDPENTVPVVMAVNENYVPYLSVAIESIKKNNKSKVFIYIFYTDLDRALIDRVSSLSCQGVRIKFIDVNIYIDKNSLYSRAHYSVEMYYRLIIPEIFNFIPKVLYLDCDIVVLDDLHDLYNIDVENKIIAAARNPVHKGMFDYLKNKLNFEHKKYFNSGILLINTRKFIEENVKDKCLEFLRLNAELACPDQDALNVICEDSVRYLDQKWNFQWHHNVKTQGKSLMTPLLEDELMDYGDASKNIKILHYTSNVKPWNSPLQDLSKYFWDYAKESPFYIDILGRNIK